MKCQLPDALWQTFVDDSRVHIKRLSANQVAVVNIKDRLPPNSSRPADLVLGLHPLQRSLFIHAGVKISGVKPVLGGKLFECGDGADPPKHILIFK